jgi:hypothetical protein
MSKSRNANKLSKSVLSKQKRLRISKCEFEFTIPSNLVIYAMTNYSKEQTNIIEWQVF